MSKPESGEPMFVCDVCDFATDKLAEFQAQPCIPRAEHQVTPVSAQGSEPSLELRDGSLWQLVEEGETGCRWVPVISRERLRKLIDASPSVSTGEVTTPIPAPPAAEQTEE